MNDDNFASDFNKERESKVGNDSNNDGILDGSPESLKKMGEEIGTALAGFFSGLVNGFNTAKKEEKQVKEEETKGPQVLNE